MGARRQLVLVRPDANGGMTPLGSVDEVAEALARFNTATDGSVARSLGTRVLYGPGFVVEIPTAQDTVNQALVNVKDEEIAWPVLSRMCRVLEWKMMDAATGRQFG